MFELFPPLSHSHFLPYTLSNTYTPYVQYSTRVTSDGFVPKSLSKTSLSLSHTHTPTSTHSHSHSHPLSHTLRPPLTTVLDARDDEGDSDGFVPKSLSKGLTSDTTDDDELGDVPVKFTLTATPENQVDQTEIISQMTREMAELKRQVRVCVCVCVCV